MYFRYLDLSVFWIIFPVCLMPILKFLYRPDLFSSLAQQLQSADILTSHRIFMIIFRTLKELSTKRLASDQRNFAEVGVVMWLLSLFCIFMCTVSVFCVFMHTVKVSSLQNKNQWVFVMNFVVYILSLSQIFRLWWFSDFFHHFAVSNWAHLFYHVYIE